jgi:flagellar basal body-associated protein FliL
MDFFNGIAGSIPFNEASRNVWVFFVVAVPISAVVLMVFFWWTGNVGRNDKKEEDKTRFEGERETGPVGVG